MAGHRAGLSYLIASLISGDRWLGIEQACRPWVDDIIPTYPNSIHRPVRAGRGLFSATAAATTRSGVTARPTLSHGRSLRQRTATGASLTAAPPPPRAPASTLRMSKANRPLCLPSRVSRGHTTRFVDCDVFIEFDIMVGGTTRFANFMITLLFLMYKIHCYTID